MQKFLKVLIVLVMGLSLTACNQKTGSGPLKVNDLVVIEEPITNVKIEINHSMPFIFEPLELKENDELFNELVNWFNDCEVEAIAEMQPGCVGGSAYTITFNDDVTFEYISACGEYFEVDEKIYALTNQQPFPIDFEDFEVAEFLSGDGMIKASSFTEETGEIIGVIEPKVSFFDVDLNAGIKTTEIAVYECEDGTWSQIGSISDYDSQHYRIALQYQEDYLDIYLINENGDVKYQMPTKEFDEGIITEVAIESSEIISVDATTNLSYKIITEENDVAALDANENTPCKQGLAVTITFE